MKNLLVKGTSPPKKPSSESPFWKSLLGEAA